MPKSYVNDGWCDCGEACEDELYWSCATCGGDACGGSCFDDESCDNSTWSYNIGDDCNFAFVTFDIPIVEGECISLFGFSYTFDCDGDEGSVTVYNTSDCTGISVEQNVNIYSCGGSSSKCDAYTITYDLYSEADCKGDSTRIYDISVADIGCVDGVDYDISTSGIEISYYFGDNGDCSGEPSLIGTNGSGVEIGQCVSFNSTSYMFDIKSSANVNVQKMLISIFVVLAGVYFVI